MKLVTKTLSKVVLEIKNSEIKTRGFESIWDDIRKLYSKKQYDIDNVGSQGNDDVIFVELKSVNLLR